MGCLLPFFQILDYVEVADSDKHSSLLQLRLEASQLENRFGPLIFEHDYHHTGATEIRIMVFNRMALQYGMSLY